MKYDLNVARKNMRKIRKYNGLTMEDLEKELGWSRSTIGNYENAIQIPKINFVIEFCNYFKISIEDLFKKEL